MMTPPVETLLLDAGGVLVFPNWDRVSRVLAGHGISASSAALQRQWPDAMLAIDHAIGIATTSDAQRGAGLLEDVLRRAGVENGEQLDAALNELRDYHAEHNLWEHVPDDVPAALQRLRGLGLTLAVASNANGTVQRAFERVGLAQYFDVIVDSFHEGVEKPDPRFFHTVIDRASGHPDSTLHVGDIYHVDIVGARNAGIRAIHLDRYDMYGGFDSDRVRSLDELATRLG